jgi:hypothetical protein
MDLAIDPLGRTVQLSEERWSHIIEEHPYMASFRVDVMRAIEKPIRSSSLAPIRLGSTFETRDPVGGSRWQ